MSNERIVDREGLVHEITYATNQVPTRIVVRCQQPFSPQMGPANIRDPDAIVTCLQCLGMPDSRSAYEEALDVSNPDDY